MRLPGTRRRRFQAHRPGRRSAAPPARPAIPLVLAFAAAVLIAGQPPSTGALTASAIGNRSAFGGDGAAGDVAAGLAIVPSADPGSATPDPSLGRGVVDDTGTIAGLTGYRWPLEHARITHGFGPSIGGLFVVAGVRFHDGIDIANFCGATIVAAHDGRVIAAGRHVNGSLGWVGDIAAYEARLDAKHAWVSLAITVVIDDGNGYRSVYVHFHSIDVTVGQVVHAGDVLGTEGSTGHATGCHLHYSLFSTSDSLRFTTEPVTQARLVMPAAEIARIDPLLVLPPLRAGDITWGWGARDDP